MWYDVQTSETHAASANTSCYLPRDVTPHVCMYLFLRQKPQQS